MYMDIEEKIAIEVENEFNAKCNERFRLSRFRRFEQNLPVIVDNVQNYYIIYMDEKWHGRYLAERAYRFGWMFITPVVGEKFQGYTLLLHDYYIWYNQNKEIIEKLIEKGFDEISQEKKEKEKIMKLRIKQEEEEYKKLSFWGKILYYLKEEI